MVLPGPPGGRVRRRRPILKTHASIDMIEAWVFSCPRLLRIRLTQRRGGRRERPRRPLRASASLRETVCYGHRAHDDYGVSDAGAAYSPHDAGTSARRLPHTSTHMSETPENDIPITVLIVDDEELLVKSCGQILASEGYTVYTEGRGRNALEVVRRQRPDIVLTDLNLPDTDGLALLKDIKKLAPETLVVMITGFATVDSSVEAIRAGAYDYIPKPFTATQLRILIGRAAQQVKLVRDNAHLRDQLKKHYSFDNIIGTSDSIQKVFGVVSRVAPTDASVLISGESGTGKELIAKAIHANSRRSAREFMAINCAALPDHLLESELFGHEKGSFTGADQQRRGLLEVASGGSFFLDEISEMSMELQAKLLRVIQERKIRRVGGEGEIPIDVRWVSATNRDPEQAVREGSLRQDLLYRLNVVPVKLPPLRHRREDIPALAQHFLRRYAQEYDRDNLRFSADAMR